MNEILLSSPTQKASFHWYKKLKYLVGESAIGGATAVSQALYDTGLGLSWALTVVAKVDDELVCSLTEWAVLNCRQW